MQELKTYLPKLPTKPGVYFFKNEKGEVIYVGKSTNIRERVKSHLSSSAEKAKSILAEAKKIEAISAEYELEALLVEAALIKEHEPRYNSRAKDDKHPLYIKISDSEGFPIITTGRRREKALYFGPFPSSSTVKQVLRSIRKVFPFHSQKVGKKACFYSHLGLCAPCPAQGKLKEQYLENIDNIVSLLSGKKRELQRKLEKQMREASKTRDFEKAAHFRDQLRGLEYITAPYKPATAYLENPQLLEDLREKEMHDLFGLLRKVGLKTVPRRIECFDVSHLRGELQTASMVTFVDGEPEKNFYRHFRIKTGKRMDDFSMMSEVLERRLFHLKDWGKPDLLLVDGGKPQLSAADRVLKKLKVDIPVVGLAKRHESIIYLTRTFKQVRLPRNSPSLQLIQRLRDEAHRFARSYHLKLRLKNLHNN